MSKQSTNKRSSSPVAFKNNLIRSRSTNEAPTNRLVYEKNTRHEFFRPIYQKPAIVQISDLQRSAQPNNLDKKYGQLGSFNMDVPIRVTRQQCTPIERLKTPGMIQGNSTIQVDILNTEGDYSKLSSSSRLTSSVNKIRCTVCGMRVVADKIDSHYQIHQNYIKLEQFSSSPGQNQQKPPIELEVKSVVEPIYHLVTKDNGSRQDSIINQMSVDISDFHIAKTSQRGQQRSSISNELKNKQRSIQMFNSPQVKINVELTRKRSESKKKLQVTCKDQLKRQFETDSSRQRASASKLPVQFDESKSPIRTDYKYQRTKSSSHRNTIDSIVCSIKQKRPLNILAQLRQAQLC